MIYATKVRAFLSSGLRSSHWDRSQSDQLLQGTFAAFGAKYEHTTTSQSVSEQRVTASGAVDFDDPIHSGMLTYHADLGMMPDRNSSDFIADPRAHPTNDHPNYDEQEASRMMEMRAWAVLCLATVYMVITVVGLATNAAVLYVIARSRRSKAVTSIYIFNLAIADLLYVVCLPTAVYPMLNGHWDLGHIMCKLYYTCDGVSKFASVMFLVVLSFDRYMAVCHPIASRSVRTAKVAFAAAGLSWLLVIVAMIPVFFYATLVKVSIEGHSTLQCAIYWPSTPSHEDGMNATANSLYGEPDDSEQSVNAAYPREDADESLRGILRAQNGTSANLNYWYKQNETEHVKFLMLGPESDGARRIFTLYLFALNFSIPLLMVWIFYIMILHRLWTQKRNLFNTNHLNGQNSSGGKSDDHRRRKSQRAMLPSNRAIQRRRRSTKRVTIMVLSIVVAYTLCWMPYWCIQITIEFFREAPALDFEIFTLASYIAYGVQSINSALNPFLYAFGTNTHRRRLMHWMRRVAYFLGCVTMTAQQLANGASSSGSTGTKSRRRRNRKDTAGVVIDMSTFTAGRCASLPLHSRGQLIKKCESADGKCFSICTRKGSTKTENNEINRQTSLSGCSENSTTTILTMTTKSKPKEAAMMMNSVNCCACGDGHTNNSGEEKVTNGAQ